ncbi:exotoxin (plasmid) [Serratia marcescens]|uniref:fimbrial protein n=1 Tax=Serratia marcescens TaxID=615 RepID=UPI0006ED036A|nr:fimbrial protein [Serratia marcescens]ALL40496.1 exotoxin [Serratia marcescens]
MTGRATLPMWQQRIGLALAALCVSAPMVTGATTLTVKVTVLSPPCVINDGHPIQVDFGDVMTTRVDGSNYRMPVNYALECKGQSSSKLKLQIQGAGAGFDEKLLRTSTDGLGIAILNGDNRLPLNQWLKFTYPNKPVLGAVPVKSTSSLLQAGEFTASATMVVDYQ